MTNQQHSISPCPFSQNYHIPVNQAWQLLAVYWIYRLILASLFVILDITHSGPALLGKHDHSLFTQTSQLYLGFVLISAFFLYRRKPGYALQTQIHIFTDIAAITLLMHASGGIASGIGMLLAVTVAAGGVLIGGRCALLFAALASLAILSEQIHADITQAFTNTAYTYTGILGASFFATALLALLLARRAEQSEALAAKHKNDLEKLQHLNNYIIQHLQSGIIVTDQNNTIRMMNDAAQALFNLQQPPETLMTLSSALYDYYQNWIQEPDNKQHLLSIGKQTTIQVRFTDLDSNTRMIFLEDSNLHNQRVQQSKLASLGRLSASIAHEIRNPLSAITHAGQLLAESPDLDTQDQRLTEIIRDHSARMNEIIENVLQLSRRTPGIQKTIPLTDWLRQYITDFQSHYSCKTTPVLINDDVDICVRIDEGHLRQILDKLCENALKHTGNNPQPSMELRISRQQPSQSPCIEVIDHGPGIGHELVQKIFEPFFTTSSSGTGLGLYIARELAELNQATLEYETIKTGGSCFRLRLLDANKEAIAI